MYLGLISAHSIQFSTAPPFDSLNWTRLSLSHMYLILFTRHQLLMRRRVPRVRTYFGFLSTGLVLIRIRSLNRWYFERWGESMPHDQMTVCNVRRYHGLSVNTAFSVERKEHNWYFFRRIACAKVFSSNFHGQVVLPHTPWSCWGFLLSSWKRTPSKWWRRYENGPCTSTVELPSVTYVSIACSSGRRIELIGEAFRKLHPIR